MLGVKKTERFWWIVFDEKETDLCIRDPGRDVDITIYATLKTLVDVWIGVADFKVEVRSGAIRLEGSKKNQKRFVEWFALSPFAKEETRAELEKTVRRL